ncbi:MAG: hypothetical protein ACOZE5_13755 [Verrucomicrobiota bacterium]
MKPRRLPEYLLAVALAVLAAVAAPAQPAAKSLDETVELAADGSGTVTVACAFDAGPWAVWKANFGDDPARARASIRYNLGARVAFDGFKLDRDDLNRTATMTVHSAVAAELRPDGRFSCPIDKEFRLVNHVGRVWFFSGNIAGTLSTIKVVLPEAARDASLVDVGSSEQALTYELPRPRGSAHKYLVAGLALTGLGVVLLGAGWFAGRRGPQTA